MWDEITYPFLNFKGCTVEVYEWISNVIPLFIKHVITYPCWDLSQTMFVKGAPEQNPPPDILTSPWAPRSRATHMKYWAFVTIIGQ